MHASHAPAMQDIIRAVGTCFLPVGNLGWYVQYQTRSCSSAFGRSCGPCASDVRTSERSGVNARK